MIGEAWAFVGGGFLAAATIPQVWQLLRTRSARDFSWAFSAMNFVGLFLFAARSFTIGERAFFLVNCLTCAFWGLVLVVKTATRGDTPAPALTSPEAQA